MVIVGFGRENTILRPEANFSEWRNVLLGDVNKGEVY